MSARLANSAFGASTASGGAQQDDFGTPIRRSGGSSANLAESQIGGEVPSNGQQQHRAQQQSISGLPSSASASSVVATKKRAALEHGDYYTKPSIDVLQKMPASSLRSVPDLIVGRVGFGEIAFSKPVDLTTLPSVESLLGGLVVFEDRNATVYPSANDDDDDHVVQEDDDGTAKPARGKGLNVPATITLENCFPVDKSTREPIKDRRHPKVASHIKRLKKLEGTEFVDYDAEAGKFTFTVEGF